jgi:hypothetical protein
MEEAINGLTELSSWSSEFNTAVNGTGGYIASAILAVGLVYTIWAIAMRKDNAKTYAIAWLICLIFTIIFIL